MRIMDFKVYKSPPLSCSLCEQQAILLPLCLINERAVVYPVCANCRDKIPYPTMPVVTVLDEGFFCCPERPVVKQGHGLIQ